MAFQRWCGLLLPAFASLIVSGQAPAGTIEFNCGTEGVIVVAEDGHDAKLACDAAASTDIQLRSLGLELHEPVRIEITQELDVVQGFCLGLYSTQERKLQVLPLDCLEGQPDRSKSFPAMKPEVLFESVIVHELLHAYLDQHSSGRFLPRIAHEYLAYAVQLEALPDRERERILEKAAVEAPVDAEDINESILSFSPLRFAAMSWLHFNQEGGDASLVRRIIEGRMLFNSVWE